MAANERPPQQVIQEGYGDRVPKRGRPPRQPVHTGPKPYVTIRDVAEATGLSCGVVARMVVEGDLEATKGHGRTSPWRISRRAVLARFPDAQF